MEFKHCAIAKENGQIRIFDDFTYLNNASPKDNFPIPIIKLMIDAILGMKLYDLWMLSMVAEKFTWNLKMTSL